MSRAIFFPRTKKIVDQSRLSLRRLYSDVRKKGEKATKKIAKIGKKKAFDITKQVAKEAGKRLKESVNPLRDAFTDMAKDIWNKNGFNTGFNVGDLLDTSTIVQTLGGLKGQVYEFLTSGARDLDEYIKASENPTFLQKIFNIGANTLVKSVTGVSEAGHVAGKIAEKFAPTYIDLWGPSDEERHMGFVEKKKFSEPVNNIVPTKPIPSKPIPIKPTQPTQPTQPTKETAKELPKIAEPKKEKTFLDQVATVTFLKNDEQEEL